MVLMYRFGNGLSDDTSEAQTVERIVELYRDALEKTGQKKTYILIAHSISGIYYCIVSDALNRNVFGRL